MAGSTTLTPAPSSVMDHLNKIHPKEEAAITTEQPKAEVTTTDTQVIEAEKAQVEKQEKEKAVETEVLADTTQAREPKKEDVKKEDTKKEEPADNEKEWYEELNSDDTTKENKPTPSAEEKAKAWDAVMSDPQMEVIFKAVQAGKRPFDVIKDVQPVDYSKMEISALAEHYGKLHDFTPEKIEEAAEWLDSLPTIQKERELQAIRKELDQNQEGLYKNASLGYEQRIVDEQRITQINNEGLEKMKAYIVDKDFHGIKLTKDDANDLESWVRTELPKTIRPDGTLDYGKVVNYWLASRKLSMIRKANLNTGISEGRKEVLKSVARVNENPAGATRIPEAKPAETPREVATTIAKKAFGGRV